MADVAVLGIRINAEGAISQLRDLDGGLSAVSRNADKLNAVTVASTKGMSAWSAMQAEAMAHVGEHSLAIGRLERALAGVAERAVGLNPVIGLLGASLGKFALGGIEMTAILGGIDLVVAGYNKMTEGARAAAAANDQLNASILAGNADFVKGKFGDMRDALAQQAKELDKLNQRKATLAYYGQPIPDDLADELTAAERSMTILNQRAAELTTPMKAVVTEIHTAKKHTDLLADAAMQADKMFQNLVETTKKLWESGAVLGDPLARLKKAAFGGLDDAAMMKGMIQGPGNLKLPDFVGNSSSNPQDWESSPGSYISKKQLEGITKINTDAEKHATMVKNAVESSAMVIAGAIGSALNLGGGGRASQIGGALFGGIAGAIGDGAKGSVFGVSAGSILGPLGAVAGGVVGSVLGGLFDHHKKAVNDNTDAINKLTQQMLNAPNGYNYRSARNSVSPTIVIEGDVHVNADNAAFFKRELLNAARGGAGKFGQLVAVSR